MPEPQVTRCGNPSSCPQGKEVLVQWCPGLSRGELASCQAYPTLGLQFFQKALMAWPGPLVIPHHTNTPDTMHTPHTHQTHTADRNVLITKSRFIGFGYKNRECTGGHTPVGRGVGSWLVPRLLQGTAG